MYSWLRRWASWLARAITLRARSVSRSNMGDSLLASGKASGAAHHFTSVDRVAAIGFSDNRIAIVLIHRVPKFAGMARGGQDLCHRLELATRALFRHVGAPR
jgi:hypothetical protein